MIERRAPPFRPPAPLLALLAAVLIGTVLAVAEKVLVPLALAVLIAFILTPLAVRLERRGVARALAVALVMALALGAVGGFGYVLSRQFVDLTERLAEYSGSIRSKMSTIRGAGRGPIENLQKTVKAVSNALAEKVAEPKGVQAVRVVPTEATPAQRLGWTIGPVIEPLATAGFVLVLVAFMLSQREDLRNRLIRLIGKGRLTVTTKTMDEMGHRISRYLLTQFLINTGFGTVLTLGLLSIGVPYALLWGALAVVLRFVPYLGTFIAMALPVMLAFAVFPSWRETVLTAGLFLGLDAVAAYVVEPLVIGHSTGVFSMALLVSALFWTWLWGPIGLVLSTPIALCLAVLGKYVPQLEFLRVLFGDEPALDTGLSFYQRLLADDEDEAGDIVDRQLETDSLAQVFDEVLVPALVLAGRDRLRAAISPEDEASVVHAIRRIADEVAQGGAPEEDGGTATPGARAAGRGRVLVAPARSEPDEAALEMLARLLGAHGIAVEPLPRAALASEIATAAAERKPDLVCVTALPPGGLANARYICKRLRARAPGLRILVLRPATEEDPAVVARLKEAGASEVVPSLTEARVRIAALLEPAVADLAPRAAPERSDDERPAADAVAG